MSALWWTIVAAKHDSLWIKMTNQVDPRCCRFFCRSLLSCTAEAIAHKYHPAIDIKRMWANQCAPLLTFICWCCFLVIVRHSHRIISGLIIFMNIKNKILSVPSALSHYLPCSVSVSVTLFPKRSQLRFLCAWFMFFLSSQRNTTATAAIHLNSDFDSDSK